MSTPLTVPLTLVNPSSVDDPYLKVVARLIQKLANANTVYDRYDRYYSGDQPLTFLAPEVAAQVGDRSGADGHQLAGDDHRLGEPARRQRGLPAR
jgi:hypothetical protein